MENEKQSQSQANSGAQKLPLSMKILQNNIFQISQLNLAAWVVDDELGGAPAKLPNISHPTTFWKIEK